MAAGGDSPYLWLAQETPQNSSSERRWVPLPRVDSEHLEAILAGGKELPSAVPVDYGRYDVDLERRVLRAVYWDEPERRCIRSSWFQGKIGGPWTPYEEEDGEGLETAFQRLRTKKEKAPLLVPVNRGTHDVRFEALPPEGLQEDDSSTWFFGGSGPKRYAVTGPLHLEKSEEEKAVKDAGSDELQFAAVQEAVERSGGQKETFLVWRGYWVVAGEEKLHEEEEERLPSRVECLTFVVHGIGQYHRAQQGLNSQFFKEVSKFRKLAMKYQLERLASEPEGGPRPHGRVEFLPLEWYGPIHVDVGIGNRLKNVTLKSVSPLRDFANFAVADIMVYLDDQWRERIHEELTRKMGQLWKLFSDRTPDYSGEIAVVGHSLGSVIMFDLMQKGVEKLPQGLHCSQKDVSPSTKKPTVPAPAKVNVATPGSFDRKGVKILKDHVAKGHVAALSKGQAAGAIEHPVPRCLFAVGSPLGMFLSIRLSQKAQRASRYFRGLDVRWPAVCEGRGWRMFNVFHPDDPIAYRIEPLLNPAYAKQNPRVVPHKGGLRWNHKISSWFTSSSASKGPDSAGLLDLDETFEEVLVVPTEDPSSFFEEKPARQAVVTVDRVDYALQVSAFESMNEMLSALQSHFSYWDNEDLLRFVVDQIHESLQSKARSSK
ncbi:unnamed protein product [Durusdinium trenchii]|uniref:DDHD domain-containing protein n=1 Tax=Durusdinium trenchii TaxID=1381693 RepID=A0ABP0IP50_9DINO